MFDLTQPILLLLQAVFGALGTYLFQFVKEKMKLSGSLAFLMVVILSIVVSSGITWVGGGFSELANMDTEAMIGLYTAFFTTTTLFFKFFMGDGK